MTDALFESWLANSRGYVENLLKSKQPRPEVVEDVLQITMVKAWKARDRCQATNESGFRSYISQVAMNALRDEYRKYTRRAGKEVQPFPTDPSADGQEMEFEDESADNPMECALAGYLPPDLEYALEVLAPIDRQIILLRAGVGGSPSSVKEIAETLGMGENEVFRALKRAQHVCQAILNPPEDNDE